MASSAGNRTVIIGGGITGLATAFYLRRDAHHSDSITLLESASRVGGKILSESEDGFLIEAGPDSFLGQKASTQELCRDLGLTSQLIPSNSNERPSTYIYSNGRMHPMPEGMMLMAPTMILPFMRSRLISWLGKLRLALELFIPARKDGADESLAGFVRRRLGTEMLDRIAAPLMAGIHAADPERLSLRSTFPMFVDMERTHGSLALAMFSRKHNRKRSAPKKPAAPLAPTPKPQPMFVSLDGGLQQLPNALAAALGPGELRLNTRVDFISNQPDGSYLIHLADGATLPADHIVLATPAYISANIVEPIAPHLAARLREIPYVSTATVSLAFRRDELNCKLQGLGFLVPNTEGRRINACTWSSTKFTHRAPNDCVLLRVFIGGALNEQLALRDEPELIQLAREELRDILGLTATPVLAKAFRWHNANPQYEVGHHDRIAEIESLAAAHPGLHLTGAAYHGAGIPDCVQQARVTALRIATAEARAQYHSKESLVTA